MSKIDKKDWACGADLVVKHLEAEKVKHVFGIPGAKVDRVFNSLVDSSIKTIIVRHEANAAFMAAAVGRLSGKAGVALVTSGPGCSNLVTGLATATSEGDAIVAIGGAVKRGDSVKQTHQSMDTVSMFKPITKYSAEVNAPTVISEVMSNAFRTAEFGRPGAAFVSLPMDIVNEPATSPILVNVKSPSMGPASTVSIKQAAKLIKQAKSPALLLGLLASRPENAQAIRQLLEISKIPTTGTYQAAGAVDMNHVDLFAGRVGLFNNQPGDTLLAQSDLIITIGYSPIEYEPALWNHANTHIIHIDVMPAEIDSSYSPDIELIGDISATLNLLVKHIDTPWRPTEAISILLHNLHHQRIALIKRAEKRSDFPIHPLRIISEMQDIINGDVTLCVDMGSFHIWIARYLYSFRARQLLISNGQQTMGVALPWGIGASTVRPQDKIVSVSGDGGFMQSSMELETAVRLKTNILHIIWVDNAYNMVEIQELKKYHRHSGVKFGSIDFKQYAQSFGAKGFSVNCVEELRPKLQQAMDSEGPAVIAIPVDYSDNYKLMEEMRYDQMI